MPAFSLRPHGRRVLLFASAIVRQLADVELTRLGQREEAGTWIAWFRAEGHRRREFAGGGAGPWTVPRLGAGCSSFPAPQVKGWNCKAAVDWPRQRCAATADWLRRGRLLLRVPPDSFWTR